MYENTHDKISVWKQFSKYHYLDSSFAKQAEQYVCVLDGSLVAHTGVIQFPMRKGWKRIHRLVVLPDFQGIGIGIRFLNAVASLVSMRGHRLNLTTTTPALVIPLKRNPNWELVRAGVVKFGDIDRRPGCEKRKLRNSSSERRPTFSFNYVL